MNWSGASRTPSRDAATDPQHREAEQNEAADCDPRCSTDVVLGECRATEEGRRDGCSSDQCASARPELDD